MILLFYITVQYRILQILEVVSHRSRRQSFLHLKYSLGSYLAGVRLAARGHVVLETQVATQDSSLHRLKTRQSSVLFTFSRCLSMKTYYFNYLHLSVLGTA